MGLASNRSCDAVGFSLRQTVHTHRASVHQAAKLVADLLRVARVTAGLTESNGMTALGAAGFMTDATCRPSAKNWDQLRNSLLNNRVWAAFTFFCQWIYTVGFTSRRKLPSVLLPSVL